MEQYRLFHEGDENIHHGNGSPLPIIQNILFAFVLPENSEISICVLENMGEAIYYIDWKQVETEFWSEL